MFVGNGYPVWTLSFCKSICGNDDLLKEIAQESEGIKITNAEIYKSRGI